MSIPLNHRTLRSLIISSMAVLMVVGTALPGMAATAVRHLPQQWWFDAWFIDTKLWKYSKGRGVTVAVLDSGVQADIPELSGAVLPGADFMYGGSDGRRDTDTNLGGHGTGIAALIASRGGSSGFLGVAPEAQILPVITRSTAAYAQGIRFAADNGAKVINLSQALAGPCPAYLQDAVRYAIERDAVIVAGAGNDGNSLNSSMHPANCKGVLAVGAADSQGGLWRKTQRQPYVDLAAPGVSAATIIRNGSLEENISGTSISAALTSGAIALVRSRYPNLSNREVVRRVVASARDIGEPGKDDRSGHGLFRPYRIFEGLLPKNPPNPVFEEYDKWLATQPKSAREPETDSKESGPSPAGAPSSGDDEVAWPAIVAAALLVGGALTVSAVIYGRVNRRRTAMAVPYGRYGPPPGPPGMGPPPGQYPTGGPPPSMGAPMPPQQYPGAPPPGGGPHFLPPAPPPGAGGPQPPQGPPQPPPPPQG